METPENYSVQARIEPEQETIKPLMTIVELFARLRELTTNEEAHKIVNEIEFRHKSLSNHLDTLMGV